MNVTLLEKRGAVELFQGLVDLLVSQAVREVAIDYTPVVVKDKVLNPLEPTIDEGGDLTEDHQRATG